MVVGADRSGRLVLGRGRDGAGHRPGSQAHLSGQGISRPAGDGAIRRGRPLHVEAELDRITSPI